MKFLVQTLLCDTEACTHGVDVHIIDQIKSAMDCMTEIDCADIVADLLQLACVLDNMQQNSSIDTKCHKSGWNCMHGLKIGSHKECIKNNPLLL